MPLADDLRTEIEAARGELLAGFEDISQEAFERPPPGAPTAEDARWPVQDVLWHVGLVEDWFRRMVDQAVGGRPIAAYEARRRPAHVNTPAMLREWLDQTRRPVLALLRRLDDADLEREFTLPEGEVRTPRRLIAYLARHDREHAEQVRSLRALPAIGEG